MFYSDSNQPLTEEQLQKFQKALLKYQNKQLNFFSSEERSAAQFQEISWQDVCPPPAHSDFIVRKLEAGEYTTRKQILDDFDLFFQTITSTADLLKQQFPDAAIRSEIGAIPFIIETLKEEFYPKVKKSLLNKTEEEYQNIVDFLKESTTIISNMPVDFDSQLQIDPTMETDTHNIPTKLL